MTRNGAIEFSSIVFSGESTKDFLDTLLAQGIRGKVFGWNIWQRMNEGLRDIGEGGAIILASGAILEWRGYCIRQSGKVRWSIRDAERSVVIWDLCNWVKRPMRAGERERYLYESIRKAGATMGVNPRGFYGLGNIASPILAANGVEEHLPPEGLIPEDILEHSLFGGRTQALKIWVCSTRTAYEYDLNSAYPWGLSMLPSLSEARIEGEPRYPGQWAVHFVEWSIPRQSINQNRVRIYPFADRMPTGRVEYPREGIGWHWSPVVDEAMKYWGKHINIIESRHIVERRRGTRPFRFVLDLYDKRHGDGGELDRKIVNRSMAALWGKLCEREGIFWEPRFKCLEWAGMTTSLVNARMLRAAMSRPHHLWAFQVDSLLFVGDYPRTLRIGEWLGEWKESTYNAIEFYQPGLWRGKRPDGSWKEKTRGIPPSDFDWSVAREEWDRFGPFGRVPVRYRDFTGLHLSDEDDPQWLERELRDGVIALRPSGGFKTAEELMNAGAGGFCDWVPPDSADELALKMLRPKGLP